MVLIYPNTYHVGMSNLGFQTVYRILNELDGVVCERAFLPETPPSATKALSTLESGKALTAFDIVAFSISFENDFPNLLTILDAAHLPLRAADRDEPPPAGCSGRRSLFAESRTHRCLHRLFFDWRSRRSPAPVYEPL